MNLQSNFTDCVQPPKNMKKPQKGKTPSRYKKKVQTDVQHRVPIGGNARTLERNVRALEDALNFLEMMIQPRPESEEETSESEQEDVQSVCKYSNIRAMIKTHLLSDR